MQLALTDSAGDSRPLLALALFLMAALLVVNFNLFYVGFISSDDAIYVSAARALLEPGNYLPTLHWGFRYTALAPIAALESLVASPPELAYSLIPLGFSLALGIAVVWFVWAYIGNRAALVTALLVSTMPLLVVWSSIINVDIIETVFLFLSFACFYTATQAPEARRIPWLLLSGLTLAGAMLTRETAYGFLIIYGLLFVLGAYFSRKHYLWVFAGVLLVVGLEMGFYMASGESPLYRFYSITQSHGSIGFKSGNFDPGTGNQSDNRWLAPIIALLVNQEFALLFYASALALVWLWFERCSTGDDRRLLRLGGFAALVFFVWLGYSGAIRPLPRYFLFAAVIALMPIAIVVQRTRFRVSAALGIAGLVATNYLALSVENLYPRFAANQITALAAADRQPIVTDPDSVSRAHQHADLLRSPDRDLISPDAPPAQPYTIVLVNGPNNDNAKLISLIEAAKAVGQLQLVRQIEPPKLLIGHLLDTTGLATLLTPTQYQWLAIRNPRVQVFRVGVDSPSEPAVEPRH
ncbi:MAG TPA: glycosyltransferase family 39 protein [Lamprocystis sp. (in: g-proteobacteria)]|nr:glycosyltransferase family 39 protein [Lamprocystis sp. (in: g-proteobacteria)]